MKIFLNNRETELSGFETMSVSDFLTHMKYTFPLIIIKINNQLIKREVYAKTLIQDGDRVEAIHLIGGG